MRVNSCLLHRRNEKQWPKNSTHKLIFVKIYGIIFYIISHIKYHKKLTYSQILKYCFTEYSKLHALFSSVTIPTRRCQYLLIRDSFKFNFTSGPTKTVCPSSGKSTSTMQKKSLKKVFRLWSCSTRKVFLLFLFTLLYELFPTRGHKEPWDLPTSCSALALFAKRKD